MTTAVHALVMAEDAEATRAFFRGVVRLPYADTGGGWLIFESGPSEIGVHPTNGGEAQFDVSLACDDLDSTASDLAARGAEFGPVQQEAWGRLTMRTVPGSVPGSDPMML
ncbi:MAG TPA: extradiol dioxygenase [Nocardioides sp.]|nr:extradiol dioxygenase [Nocardioides sp.]